MPSTGRAAVSSSARHTRKTSQSASDYHQAHRREKTKSSPSYVQRLNRESAPNTSADPPPTQRPFKHRAHSAPQVPKSGNSHLPGTEPDQAERDDPDDDDDDETSDLSDDEAIADDPFFQRYDMSRTDRQNEQQSTFMNRDDMVDEDMEGPLSPTSTVMRARPDSTAEPMQSPLSPHSPSSVNPAISTSRIRS
jgi:hypothetical protein